VVVDGRFDSNVRAVFILLEFPDVFSLVVKEAGVVVALVEVFEHRAEDLGLFFGEGDAFGVGFEELAAAAGGEEGGGGEDVLVGGEEALVRADAKGDYGGCEGTDVSRVLDGGFVG